MCGSGNTTLIISNDDLDNLIKIITALEEHDILSKGVDKTLNNEIKKQERGMLSTILGTLAVSLLGNLLTGKGLYRTVGQGTLTKFEIMDYFKNVKGFNGVYSRNNLPNLKNGAYAINLDHSENTGTH